MITCPVKCECNYLSIPKLQRLHLRNLGMDKLFHSTIHNGCNDISMLKFKLNHVSKRGSRTLHSKITLANLHSQDIPTLLTHWVKVMPYGNNYLRQHWLRLWLVAWQHQAITWTNFDLKTLASISDQIQRNITRSTYKNVQQKIIFLRIFGNLLRASELRIKHVWFIGWFFELSVVHGLK